MIKNLWVSVMDPDHNPLMGLSKMTQFQIMTYLSIMWCMIFTVWTGWLYLLGPSAILHVLILIGIFFTHSIFKSNRRVASPRDLYKDTDGCVKYDDLWGG